MRSGSPTDAWQIQLNFARCLVQAGITRPFSIHSLRHTFASWLAIQGESLLTIGALLGHKSPVMTKRYAHLSPDHKRRAVELLEHSITQKAEQAEA